MERDRQEKEEFQKSYGEWVFQYDRQCFVVFQSESINHLRADNNWQGMFMDMIVNCLRSHYVEILIAWNVIEIYKFALYKCYYCIWCFLHVTVVDESMPVTPSMVSKL